MIISDMLFLRGKIPPLTIPLNQKQTQNKDRFFYLPSHPPLFQVSVEGSGIEKQKNLPAGGSRATSRVTSRVITRATSRVTRRAGTESSILFILLLLLLMFPVLGKCHTRRLCFLNEL